MRTESIAEKFAFVAVLSILSELDGIFILKEEQRKTLEVFFGGRHVFTLLPSPD